MAGEGSGGAATIDGDGRDAGTRDAGTRGAGRPDAGTRDAGTRDGRGRLFVVSTPIGNLGDMTYRGVEVLRSVPLVAAEDTRLTRRLFARYEIATRLVSYHAHSGSGREAELLAHLRDGGDLAVVTDAGTPAVSDPGGKLASAWAAEGGSVIPIPGASAVLAALVASGLAAPRWSFEGFLPRSGRERRDRLARVAADDRACVLYEAPSRVPALLRDLAAACGPSRRAAVCRELTKLHEEVVRGTLAELGAAAGEGRLTLRGEFAIVVEALVAGSGAATPPDALSGTGPSLEEASSEVERLVADGVRRADAVRRVASAMGLDRRALYAATQRDRRD